MAPIRLPDPGGVSLKPDTASRGATEGLREVGGVGDTIRFLFPDWKSQLRLQDSKIQLIKRFTSKQKKTRRNLKSNESTQPRVRVAVNSNVSH